MPVPARCLEAAFDTGESTSISRAPTAFHKALSTLTRARLLAETLSASWRPSSTASLKGSVSFFMSDFALQNQYKRLNTQAICSGTQQLEGVRLPFYIRLRPAKPMQDIDV